MAMRMCVDQAGVNDIAAAIDNLGLRRRFQPMTDSQDDAVVDQHICRIRAPVLRISQ